MTIQDVRNTIQGYTDIRRELEVLSKYGFDYTTHKGRTNQILNNYHPPKIQLAVSEIREESRSTKTMRLSSPEGYLPPFQAGQYINLFLTIDHIKTSRPYSISSSPSQTAYYDITVGRVEDGFVSNYLLDELNIGDLLESTSPAGHFYYNPLYHGKNLVFLAGGTGVTPFISMIREVADRNLNRTIHLVYGSRTEQDILFREELDETCLNHENIRVSHVISEPEAGYQGLQGFISAELLRNLKIDLLDGMFYICGPEAMYTFCLSELATAGVLRRRTRTEVFGLQKDISQHPGWPDRVSTNQEFQVTIKNRKKFTVRAGEPLLNAFEREGFIIPACCRSGECSLCRARLISGQVFQPAKAKVRKSDRKFGYIHLCASYPLENLEILI